MVKNRNSESNPSIDPELSYLADKGLNSKQIHAIFHLANTPGITDKEVAAKSGITASTLSRWKQQTYFKDALDETIIYLKKVEHAKEVEYIRECTYKLGKSLWSLSTAMHTLTDTWLNSVSIEDLKPQELIKLIEVYDKVSSSSLDKMNAAWGLQDLLDNVGNDD